MHLVLPEYIDKTVENHDSFGNLPASLFILKYLQNGVIILMIQLVIFVSFSKMHARIVQSTTGNFSLVN